MQGTSGMSLTCHKNSRAVERILPQTEKLKKMKSKGSTGAKVVIDGGWSKGGNRYFQKNNYHQITS